MDLDEYQRLAQETDQFPDADEDGRALTIPMLGIIGEMGSIATCFKKRMRDGSSYQYFERDLQNEMGDILWYLANIAKKWDFSLNHIAEQNLQKVADRWSDDNQGKSLHHKNTQYPETEQFPEEATVEFKEIPSKEGDPKIITIFNDQPIGDHLTNNSHLDDGYRYHDIFHISYAAILGWSPVLRSLLKIKRKSSPTIDEVEDGARAAITEEFIANYIFVYAEEHNMLEEISEIDYETLSTIKSLTSNLEAKDIPISLWKEAIFEGFRVYKHLKENKGGLIKVNFLKSKMEILEHNHDRS